MTSPKKKSPSRRRDEVSLCSEVLPDGTYGIVLSRGDSVRWLSREDVYRHSMAVMSASIRAEHDAAIFRQLTGELNLTPTDAAHMIADLRERRAPVDAQALQPLGLEPGVTIQGKPFLVLSVGGHKIGQWKPQDARQHALACMELAEAVPRDNDYFTFLSTAMELDGGQARAVVSGLAEFIGHYTVAPR